MSTMIIADSGAAAVVPAGELSLPQRMFFHCLGAVVGLGRPRPRDERGITTIEYVIGIIAGITIVGVLILALSNEHVQNALMGLLKHIFGMGDDPSTQVKTHK